MSNSKRLPKEVVLIGVSLVVIFVLITVFSSFTVLDATERGIIKTFGKPSETVLSSGIQTKIPWVQTIQKYTVVPMTYEVTIDIGDGAAITKDNQSVGTTVGVLFAWDESRLYEAITQWDKKTVERGLANLIVQGMKTTIGKYTIFDLAVQQDSIRQEVTARLVTQAKQYPISVTQLTIANWDWSKEFEQQIQATMQAAQQVRKADQEAQIVEQKARQLKIQADAEAAALVAKAEGELKAAEMTAKAEIERARGKNEANRLLNQNLNVEVKIRELEIAKLQAEKWDGRKVANFIPLTAGGTMVDIGNVK